MQSWADIKLILGSDQHIFRFSSETLNVKKSGS
jgi:hypothetical protein